MKIYPVTPSRTGAVRSQPHSEAVRLEACLAGPPGGPYVDLRQSIDAPEYIPTGSVRALDFPGTVDAAGTWLPPIRMFLAARQR